MNEKVELLNDGQFHIEKLKEAEEKHEWAPSLRSLWRECFGDPLAYENFYFSNVYRENQVYGIRDKGMLHLNPYRCKVQGKKMTLHYIVGVATSACARRQGIMRSLLTEALRDMAGTGEPFTYLMPAEVKYYEPFDFVSICEKRETTLVPENSNQNIQFVNYQQLVEKWTKSSLTKFFVMVDEMLAQQHCVYAVHDSAYFDLLYCEKKCQSGDVVFCFDGEIEEKSFLGFFAYGADGEEVCVEQCVFPKCCEYQFVKQCVVMYGQQQGNTKEIHVVEQFPYMLRIVNMEVFLNLFKNYFKEFALEKKALCVEDSIISDNSGMYVFFEENGEIQVKKCRLTEKREDDTIAESRVTMTVKETADYVLRRVKETQRDLFFAEVV